MRGNVAMSGNFGYELDLTKLREKEKEEVKKQITFYKDIRHIIQFGKFYRLLNPFVGNEAAWLFISEDKTEVVVLYSQILSQPNPPLCSLRLKGLNPNFLYRDTKTGEVYGGDELMYAGIAIPQLKGDFNSVIWSFKRIK